VDRLFKAPLQPARVLARLIELPGLIRYRCAAALALIAEWSGALPHRLQRSPAVIFNCKDALPDAYLSQHSSLRDALYTRHFVPAVDAFALPLGRLGAIATHF
jgi:hypothetical protein